jgi:hypothetical protein
VKKFCAFILAIFYFGFSIGVALNHHYCMGDFVGTSLFDFRDKECGKCGMKKHTEASKDCCKDVSIVIKVSDSHTFSQTAYDFHAFTIILPVTQYICTSANTSDAQLEKSFRAHSPPLLSTPLFIQFRNFRI